MPRKQSKKMKLTQIVHYYYYLPEFPILPFGFEGNTRNERKGIMVIKWETGLTGGIGPGFRN